MLDYGWWASDGPTAGYLASLALYEGVERAAATGQVARGIDVYLLRRPAADHFSATTAVAAGDRTLAVTTFEQGRRFAVAAVQLNSPRGSTAFAPAQPPPVLPPEAYREMATGTATLPPVTAQFFYRPATEPDGTSPEPGWDLVWLQPRGDAARGRGDVARMIDCWYPGHFMLAVRDHLRRGLAADALGQPPLTHLTSAHLVFPSQETAYDNVRHALLATRVIGATDGNYFEQSELWSEYGDLLVSAQLNRRDRSVNP
jgi:hypothetical protein